MITPLTTALQVVRGQTAGVPRVLRDLSVFRPALRIHEAKTRRLGVPRVVSAYLVVEDLDELGTLGMCPVVAAAPALRVPGFRGFTCAAVERSRVALGRRALRTGAAVGLSTCAAFSRGQNLSFWLCGGSSFA